MYNSEEYSWKDLSINILGRVLNGVTGLKYSEKTDIAPVYGRGQKPIALQSGNMSFEGEITLLQSEAIALQNAAKAAGKRVSQISFDIVASYAIDTTINTDIVKGVKISDFEKALKQGDKNMEIAFKFMALDVQSV